MAAYGFALRMVAQFVIEDRGRIGPRLDWWGLGSHDKLIVAQTADVASCANISLEGLELSQSTQRTDGPRDVWNSRMRSGTRQQDIFHEDLASAW
jgi:hypothetical protein